RDSLTGFVVQNFQTDTLPMRKQTGSIQGNTGQHFIPVTFLIILTACFLSIYSVGIIFVWCGV
ncbi:MAG TPA: hypothetical protein PK133_12010, partial [Ferruginibacter sp.]|nr:hypothetical protein [Ferruginibacter sp.]